MAFAPALRAPSPTPFSSLRGATRAGSGDSIDRSRYRPVRRSGPYRCTDAPDPGRPIVRLGGPSRLPYQCTDNPLPSARPLPSIDCTAPRQRPGSGTGIASAPHPQGPRLLGPAWSPSAAEGRSGEPFAGFHSSTRSRESPTRHEPGPGPAASDATSSSFRRGDSRVLSQGAFLLAPTPEPRMTDSEAGAPPSPVTSTPFARGPALPKTRTLPRALHAEDRSSPIATPEPAPVGEGGPPRWGTTPRQAPIGSRRHPSPPEPPRRSLGPTE